MSTETENMLKDLHEFPKDQLEKLSLLSKDLKLLSTEFTKGLEPIKLRESFKNCWKKLLDEKGEFNLEIESAISISDIDITANKIVHSFFDSIKKYAPSIDITKVIAGWVTLPPILTGTIPAILGNLGVQSDLLSQLSSYKIGQAAPSIVDAASQGTKEMLKPAVLLGSFTAGVGCAISIHYFAQEFLTSLRKTLTAYYNLRRTKANDIENFKKKLDPIYQNLKKEFGSTEDGRYKITRAIRWFNISWDHFSIAYLLLAEMGAELGKSDCYEEYTKAFKGTNDDKIKALSLWGKIKLLSSSTDPKKQALFQIAVNNFKKLFPDLIQNYLSQIYKTGYISFNKKVVGKFYMIEHNDPHAAFYKIFCHFRKSIKPLCEKTHFFDSATYKTVPLKIKHQTLSSIKINLSQCWKFIMNSNIILEIKSLSCHELKILHQIMSFMNSFLDSFPVKDAIFAKHPTLISELGYVSPRKLSEKQFIASTVLSNKAIFDAFCEANGDNSCQNLSLEGILSTLINSEKFAKMTIKTHSSNWLHFLGRVSDSLSKTQDRINKYKLVFKKLREYGVSFYQRTAIEITPFICIAKDDSNGLEKLMRPATESGDHFIGIDAQMKELSEFLKNAQDDNDKTGNRAIYLCGPAGVGKTELIKYLSASHGYSCEEFERAKPGDQFANQFQVRLKEFFENARSLASEGTCVCLFMDELDTIAADYQGKPMTGSLNQQAIVSAIQQQIDKLKHTRVVFIGATNHEENINPDIRCRMRAIHFSLPDEPTRKRIIEDQLRNYYVNQEIIDKLSEATCSWSPRSIVNLIKVSIGKQKILSRLIIENFIPAFEATRKSIAADYLKKYNLAVEPPKLEETNNKNGVTYNYFNEELKERFDFITCYLRNPKAYIKRPAVMNSNTLLLGEPGTGKSLFAANIADKVKCFVIKVNSGSIQLKPERIEKIFSIANSFERSVILFDEMDAIASESSPCHTSLQSYIDGLEKNDTCMAIIGTTNKKHLFSQAMLNRFTCQIKVTLPNVLQLKTLFLQYLLPDKLGLNVDLKARLDRVCESLATRSAGTFTPRDVSQMVSESVILAETRHQMYMYESKSKTASIDPKRRPSIKEEDLEKCFQRKLATYS